MCIVELLQYVICLSSTFYQFKFMTSVFKNLPVVFIFLIYLFICIYGCVCVFVCVCVCVCVYERIVMVEIGQ